MQAKNMFEKLWDQHVVKKLDGENDLLYIDRCYVHDLGGALVLDRLKRSGHKAAAPDSVYCCPDHTVSEQPGRDEHSNVYGECMVLPYYALAQELGLNLIRLSHQDQGIIHNIGPELGLSLPGMTVVCGDSHTCTHGAVGAMAWGVGTSALYHVLATRTLAVKRPKTMRILLQGDLQDQTEAMDIVLYLLSVYGTALGVGYALEYAGETVAQMEIDDRATLCNLSVELGAQICLIEPDEKTLDYIRGRKYAPYGMEASKLEAYSKAVCSDVGARWDKEIVVDVSCIRPQITWGIDPSQTIPIDGDVPINAGQLQRGGGDLEKALAYTGVQAGKPILGLEVDRVFIGSCANGRLADLKRVAKIVQGKKVASHVSAWIIPGSKAVKREAEKLGLDRIFQEAGFLWGEPGCSLCSCANGQKIEPGKRCVSTSNRNFIGRQGPGAITHLASPSTAALAAINGRISDIRCLKGEGGWDHSA